MGKFENIDNKYFFNKKFDDSYAKNFFIKQYIIQILNEIEKEKKKVKTTSEEDFKKILNKNIGEFYNLYNVPYVYFIRMLILVSIEGGDLINFSHKIHWSKFKHYFNYQ